MDVPYHGSRTLLHDQSHPPLCWIFCVNAVLPLLKELYGEWNP